MGKQKVEKQINWSKAGTYDCYEDADAERKLLQNDESVQTKVRRRHQTGLYTVHYRKITVVRAGESSKKANKKEARGKKKRAQRET